MGRRFRCNNPRIHCHSKTADFLKQNSLFVRCEVSILWGIQSFGPTVIILYLAGCLQEVFFKMQDILKAFCLPHCYNMAC